MATTITAGNATNGGAAVSADNTGILELKTGTGSGTTAMTITAAGAVGFGTSAPTSAVSLYDATLAVFSVDGDATTQIRPTRYSNDVLAPSFVARKTRGSLSSPTAISTGDSAGNVVFQSYGGTNYRTIAQVTGAVETYTADDNMAGALFFYTRPAGAGAAVTEQARITSAGLFQFNSGYGSVATAYGCRAWVNFNGTGTVAIRASGNVSSITDNNTGDYTVNFTTAMPDANYSVNISGLSASATDGRAAYFVRGARSTGTPSTQTTSAVQVSSYDAAAAGWPAIDAGYICVAIFR